MAKETSQTLDRGLSVLEVLAEFPEGLSVTELSHKLGVGRTVVYRLVVTLEAHSLLRRSADGKCRLGLGLLSLARVIQPLVREASGPALRMLAEALSCTAYLMIADVNDGLVALVSEPNRSDMHVSIRIGTRSPLEGSAGGRAILAARTAAGRPLDPPWVVANLEGGTYGLAVPLTGVAGLEASVGIVSAREFAETEFGPRITRSAQEIARMLM
ncbi:MAG: helix-turn-helix domain-containing protein [Actinomycetia bacterium]|nr:helix-turn-helix domain-containing protein [Actinomycetes bacterium]MCH9830560.1 helix-turn-helix domain-containing protein [Actinomycetes bacterium]MCH9839811.1 helix-turn-helix domain-containing protein [Actinomycetes bacterium]